MRLRRLSPRAAGGGSLIALGLLLLLALVGVWTYAGPGPPGRDDVVTSVILPRGAGVRQIAAALQDAGVIRSPGLFAIAARITGAASHLKAGEYEIASGASMASILADLRAGRTVRHLVSVPEGWTSAMALDAVNAEPVLTGQAEAPPEGALLPDTYEVQRGEDRAAVIARMRAARDKVLADLWAGRDPGLPLSRPEDAVTLASIVEKETGVAAERPRIAAIFINRLRAGMALQSDPTIIYGLTRGRPLGRGLRASELANVNPYNSYKVTGLPPTPIANPGRAALAAVLHPAKTDELYFVADGTGGHAFASTYEQHEKNVARWREIERAQGGGALMPITGMTGFGRAEGALAGWAWAVEARSVNGRNLEVRFRGPPGFDGLERAAREGAQARFQRGQLTVGVQAKRSEGAGSVRINAEQFERFLEFGAGYVADGRVSAARLDGLLSLRGVIEAEDAGLDPEALAELEAAMAVSIGLALDGLAQSRAVEGRALLPVLSGQVDRIGGLATSAREVAAGQPAAIKARFEARLKELAGEAASEERIVQEAAAMAVKADVREELDRLAGHVDAARGLLSSEGGVGRRLDFLTQEFMREANTLCSKSQTGALTTLGLDLKATIEQFREQVQNVE